MDDKHFDNLIRSIGSGLSRRKALRSALGGLAAAAGVTAAAAETKKGKAKAEGKSKPKGKADGKKKSKKARAEQSSLYGCNAQQVAICHNTDQAGRTSQCVATSAVDPAAGHCGHPGAGGGPDCFCPGQGFGPTTPGCPLPVCGSCTQTAGGACSLVALPTTTTVAGPTTTTVAGPTTTTVAGPTTTTVAGPTTTTQCPDTCEKFACGKFNCRGRICGGCSDYKHWCVLADDGRSATCKALPSKDCAPNGKRGLCCSGFHKGDGICCDPYDAGATPIVVTNSNFNSISGGTSPTSVITTVSVPPSSGGGTTIITTPSVGGAGRRRKRRRRGGRRGGRN